MPEADPMDPGRRCPWCSAPVPPGATRCPSCGDAIAQRDAIGDLEIPGVTVVDPSLAAYDAQPSHIPLSIPSRVDPTGGAINLRGMADLAALAAPASVGGRVPAHPNLTGTPTEAALETAERLDREDSAGLGRSANRFERSAAVECGIGVGHRVGYSRAGQAHP